MEDALNSGPLRSICVLGDPSGLTAQPCLAVSSRARVVSKFAVVARSPPRMALRNTETTWSAVAVAGTATGGASGAAGPLAAG